MAQSSNMQSPKTQTILPSNAIALIHEYSRPITPYNWKKRKWICVIDVYRELQKYKNKNNKYDKHYNLYSRFIINVQRNHFKFNISWWNSNWGRG